jgi:hypothetical protein
MGCNSIPLKLFIMCRRDAVLRPGLTQLWQLLREGRHHARYPAGIRKIASRQAVFGANSQPVFQPVVGASYPYLEELGSSGRELQVAQSIGTQTVDTVEVRSSSLLVPTISFLTDTSIPTSFRTVFHRFPFRFSFPVRPGHQFLSWSMRQNSL